MKGNRVHVPIRMHTDAHTPSPYALSVVRLPHSKQPRVPVHNLCGCACLHVVREFDFKYRQLRRSVPEDRRYHSTPYLGVEAMVEC